MSTLQPKAARASVMVAAQATSGASMSEERSRAEPSQIPSDARIKGSMLLMRKFTSLSKRTLSRRRQVAQHLSWERASFCWCFSGLNPSRQELEDVEGAGHALARRHSLLF